ncbi:MAG: hypothetical protein AAF352_00455, partial [Pseudomonadota bacterium]
MITHAMHPSGNPDQITTIFKTQLGAMMGSVLVHKSSLIQDCLCQRGHISAWQALANPLMTINRMTAQLYITNSRDLQDFCQRAAQYRAIAVDTEFIRKRTYWAQLCLIQIGLPDGTAAIIDFLHDDLDFTPLTILLTDLAITKVFHAAKQDVETLFHSLNVVIAPLFDTQLAALACGYGDQVGYGALVQKFLSITIPKDEQFSDWQARPLSDKQIAYAYQDVTHLITLYPILSEELHECGREGWIAAETLQLQNPLEFTPNAADAWKRVKIRPPIKPRT